MASRMCSGSPIPTSPGPLFASLSPVRSSLKKLAASPARSKSPHARRRITYADGGSAGEDGADGSDRERPSHTGGSCDCTSSDDRPDGVWAGELAKVCVQVGVGVGKGVTYGIPRIRKAHDCPAVRVARDL